MAFTDLTGRHAISVIGAAPMQSAVGGPSGGYTNFPASGALVVADPADDFLFGTGDFCVEVVAWRFAGADLVPSGSHGRILDVGQAYYGHP